MSMLVLCRELLPMLSYFNSGNSQILLWPLVAMWYHGEQVPCYSLSYAVAPGYFSACYFDHEHTNLNAQC
jgi:hypothetical protein